MEKENLLSKIRKLTRCDMINENVVLRLLSKTILYFPTRFLICGFFFSFVLLSNTYLQTTENQILFDLLQFFQIPSHVDNESLFVGTFSQKDFSPSIKMHILFMIFFPSLAIATSASFDKRLRILFFGALCFVGLVLTQFLIIMAMLAFGISSYDIFLEASIFFISLVGGLFIEITLFSTITVPKSTSVKLQTKRSFLEQYIYLAIVFSSAVLLIYLISPFFDIATDSPTTAYLTISLSELLFLKYYTSFFIYELKTPQWAKAERLSNNRQYGSLSMSFLLSAFNEEKHIRSCIESIDVAAAHYPGKTEVIVINDGSTDNTREIASEAVLNLRHASGKVYNIPHGGLGYALQYGLKRTSGDIIFRTDADSTIDKHAIGHIMKHFMDPQVASVSGLILPLEEKSWWQKLWIFRYCLLTFYKREWELTDSVIVQPGAFTVFRKKSLIRVGGWADDIIGEDCEVTVRLGRFGYRHEYEQHAIVKSDTPSNLEELRQQRVRWSVSFYQAFASNLNVIKERNGPLSIMYVLRIMQHGSTNAGSLFVPFFLAYLVLQPYILHSFSNLLIVITGIAVIDLLTYGLENILIVYFLYKFKKMYLIKYLPLQRLYHFIQIMFIEPEALEILLSVSSKWKEHSKELTLELRKRVKHGIHT